MVQCKYNVLAAWEFFSLNHTHILLCQLLKLILIFRCLQLKVFAGHLVWFKPCIIVLFITIVKMAFQTRNRKKTLNLHFNSQSSNQG